MRKWVTLTGAAIACGLLVIAVAYGPALFAIYGPDLDGQERATVALTDANGSQVATVDVRIANDGGERYRGLSNTDSLTDGEGMLFVYPRADSRTFVMREMNYGLDIVFVASDGRITSVHHAPQPPPGTSGSDLTPYRGYGQFVLEVPFGYTNRTGVEVGDRVVVPERYR